MGSCLLEPIPLLRILLGRKGLTLRRRFPPANRYPLCSACGL